MTFVMGDSTVASNIPSWVTVEAGYVDGKFQSYYGLDPRKHRLSITTNGLKPADFGDIERYDLSISDAPRILDKGSWGLYISVAQVATLLKVVPRPAFKLWTAHYGAGKHICNPGCYPGMPTWADGTQWVDHGPWDESLLLDNFFTLGQSVPVFTVKETETMPFGTPVVENGRAYIYATGAGASATHLFLVSADLNGANPSFEDLTDTVGKKNNGTTFLFK